MTFLEAFEQLNEAKTASELRPLRLAQVYKQIDFSGRIRKAQQKILKILKGTTVLDKTKTKKGTIVDFSYRGFNSPAEIVTIISAQKRDVENKSWTEHQYVLDPAGKKYRLDLLGSYKEIIQPEPAADVEWQDLSCQLKIRPDIKWEDKQEAEQADFTYWLRSPEYTGNASFYVESNKAREAVNKIIREFNAEVTKLFNGSEYWQTYKTNWLEEQRLNIGRDNRQHVKEIEANWDNLTPEERREYIDDKAAPKMAMLTNAASQIKTELESSQGDNIWTAIGWLAKHTINLRVRGPEEYYKNQYESEFGPGYESNGHSAKRDWPGGTLICDAPISTNSSAFSFVSGAIISANANKETSSFINETRALTATDKSTNCLQLVIMLLKEYNFHMGPGKQSVNMIAPKTEKALELFNAGYNS